jgi:hypothetical protein
MEKQRIQVRIAEQQHGQSASQQQAQDPGYRAPDL